MNDTSIMLLIWFAGWLILSVCYYIYKVYIDCDKKVNKKVHVWRSFWVGAWSWVGIIFSTAFLIVGFIAILDDWIESTLNT